MQFFFKSFYGLGENILCTTPTSIQLHTIYTVRNHKPSERSLDLRQAVATLIPSWRVHIAQSNLEHILFISWGNDSSKAASVQAGELNLGESTEQKKQAKETSWKSSHYLKHRSTESLGWLPSTYKIKSTPLKKPHNHTTAPQRRFSVVLTISDYYWKSLASTSQVFHHAFSAMGVVDLVWSIWACNEQGQDGGQRGDKINLVLMNVCTS